MQIKIFTIPILGSERINEEMNAFLRSKREVPGAIFGSIYKACRCYKVQATSFGTTGI